MKIDDHAEEAARIRKVYEETSAPRIMRCMDLVEGKEVIDIGCRNGGFSYLLQRRFPEKTVYGADYFEESIAVGKQAFPEVSETLLVDSIYSTSLPERSFDCVTFMATIEHLEQAALAIKNINRILRPGGVLIITTDNPFGFSFLRGHFRFECRNAFRRLLRRSPYPLRPVIFNPDIPFARHVYEWRPQTLLTLCHVNGFRYEAHEYTMPSPRRSNQFIYKLFPFLGDEQILKVRKVEEAPTEFV